ncbi:hypothetical protein HMPREF9057_00364 [Actinomyces sp. oral taxon 171 str. F0337]|nr:hypothetical protein HMPREF9057_00364 [Actinomyces sp. oral taxon 171 str. F0337]
MGSLQRDRSLGLEVSNRSCAQGQWRHSTNPHTPAQACGYDLWITPLMVW